LESREPFQNNAIALADLDGLPTKIAAGIVKKIGRLEAGLHGDIKRLKEHDRAYRLRMGTIASSLTWRAKRLQYAASNIVEKLMTKATLKILDADIKKRRREVTRLQEDLEDLEDYLDVLEARRKSLGKSTLTQAEAERRYGVK